MKWVRRVALLLLALLVVCALVYAALPWLVDRLSPSLASRLGVERLALSMDRPGWRQVKIAQLEIEAGSTAISGEEVTLTYTLAGLLDGRLEEVDIGRLDIAIAASPDVVASTPTTDDLSLAAAFNVLPAQLVKVKEVVLRVEEPNFVGSGAVELAPTHVLIEMNGVEPAIARDIALELRLTPEGQFAASLIQPGSGEQVPEKVLSAAGQLKERQIEVVGDVALRGYLLSLVGRVLGYPVESGQVVSRFRLESPLPVDDSLDRKALVLQLTEMNVDWHDAVSGIRVLGLTGRTELRAGRLQAALAGQVRAADDAYALNGALDVDADVDLEGLDTVEGDVRYRGRLSVDETEVTGDVAGRLSWTHPNIHFQGQVNTQVLQDVGLRVRHDLQSAVGNLFAQGVIDIETPLLATVLPEWSEPYDFTDGRVHAGVEVHWQDGALGASVVDAKLDDVAASYEDYVASGINGEVEMDVSAWPDWSIAPLRLKVDSIDVGLPLQDTEIEFAGRQDRLEFTGIRTRLLGGHARTPRFVYKMDSGSAAFDLCFEELDLAKVLALEGEDVTGTGTLEGCMPVVIKDNAAEVVKGRMSALPPGGTIRLSESLARPTGQASLDFALRALQDFAYTELIAGVTYSPSGELDLAVELKGRNPEVERGRPIHYNLNISENIPVLLESLRLQDKVTERIERQVRQ